VIAATTVIALAAPPPVGYVALAVTGFALAPVFPFLIAATPSRLGETHTTNAVGFQVSAAVLGATLLPSGMGVIAQRFGVEAVPVSWLASACLLFVLHELLVRARGAAPELAV
jgi:fucose permease